MSDANKAFTDEHLSAAFFATALSHGLSDDRLSVTVEDLQITAGSAIGDNFCSDIFRAVVRYRLQGAQDRQTVSLIIKAMPYTEARTPVLEDLQVFDKEFGMYTDTLPKMSRLLGGERLSAKCFYAVKEPVQLIVFEDLKAAGFKMADRTAGLDEEHCRCVLQKLGRFHAASVRLVEQEPEAMGAYSFGLVKPDALPSPVMDAVFVSGILAVTENMREWPGYEGTTRKFEALSENFLKKLDIHCNGSRPQYSVLNHGDLWVNNFLFQYDAAGRPTDVCFVDYQMSVYTSPGHDLNYFLNTSPQNEVREHRRDAIVDYYFAEFVATLERLHSDQTTRFSRPLLGEEIASRELYGLLASVGILPLVLMTRDSNISLEALTAEESSAEQVKAAMFNNPHYVKAMRYIVRRFDEEGVLDRVPHVE